MGRTPLEDTTTKVIFETKMLATMILSTSMMAALVAGSALPHPEMPPLQERGECMAWSWSSATGWKCTQELNTEVGVGVAQEGSKVVVVANYSPPGNYGGQYVDN